MAACIAYQVKLVCLANGEEQIFRGMESFTFTNDSKHLILKGRNAENAVELNLYDLEKKQMCIRDRYIYSSGKSFSYDWSLTLSYSRNLSLIHIY